MRNIRNLVCQEDFTVVRKKEVLKGGISVGTRHQTTQGWIEVVEIITERKVRVRFLEYPCEVIIKAIQIRLGQIKNPMRPSVCGVGYFGVGKYDAKSHIYRCWGNMLLRVYRPPNERTEREYKGTSVCAEWHNFQVFAEWYVRQLENKPSVEFRWEIDKDWRKPGNKVYSPDTCCMVPSEINMLLQTPKIRNRELLGMKMYRNTSFQVVHRGKYLKSYRSLEEAHDRYWSEKIRHINYMGAKFWNHLPSDVASRILNFNREDALAYFGKQYLSLNE